MVSEVSGNAAPSMGVQTRSLIGVSAAHWVSHVHIMTLPPLFIILKDTLGVGYVELGFAITVFGIVSALTQAPMGYVVDQFGARRLLVAGLCLGGCAFVLLGVFLSYPMMLICVAVAGLANSVYHPSDYAILSSAMDEKRMGRAFSVHTCAGMFGGAIAPVIGLGLALNASVGWALIVLGALGPLAALLIVLLRIPESETAAQRAAAKGGDSSAQLRVLSPAILALVVFFILLGLSNGGLTNFGIAALQSGYAVSLELASLTLTLFLSGVSVGVLAGGVLADRTQRHGHIAAICFAVNAVIFAIVTLTTPVTPMLIGLLTVAGFLSGLISPSRDMMVRKAAPPGAAGRAFGIVSTGFNISSIIGPMLFGYIMDQDAPRWVFGMSTVFMVLTVMLALATEGGGLRMTVRKRS